MGRASDPMVGIHPKFRSRLIYVMRYVQQRFANTRCRLQWRQRQKNTRWLSDSARPDTPSKVTYNTIFAAYVPHRNGRTNVTVTNVTVATGHAANPPLEDRSDHRSPISNGLRGNHPSDTALLTSKHGFAYLTSVFWHEGQRSRPESSHVDVHCTDRQGDLRNMVQSPSGSPSC